MSLLPIRTSTDKGSETASYWNRYQDLQNAFGDNADTGRHLVEHWLTFGIIPEMRQGSDFFSLGFYHDHHPDLQNAFGRNAQALFDHWVAWGNSEGRLTAPDKILRMGFRREGGTLLIVAAEGTLGSSDPDLFNPFNTTGGQIGLAIGLVIGVYAGNPVNGAAAGALIGHGLDRTLTRIANDITGPAWKALEHGPVGKALGDAGGTISDIFHHI